MGWFDEILSGIGNFFGGGGVDNGYAAPTTSGDVDAGYWDTPRDFSSVPLNTGNYDVSGGGGNWLSSLLSTDNITSGMKTVLPYALMLGMSSMGGGGEQKTTTQQQFNYPSQQYIDALNLRGVANAGRERQSAYDSLARNLSVRGFGAGSGYSKGKAAGIENAYLDSLSNLNNKLIDVKNTGTPAGSTTTTQGGGVNPLAMLLGLNMNKLFQ